MKKIFLLTVLLFVGLYCSRMPKTHYYTLEFAKEPANDSKSDHVLYIKSFEANPLFEQDQFIYRSSLYEVEFDYYRRWALSPPILLTTKAYEYFLKSGLFARVVKNGSLDSDYYVLSGRLDRFEEINYGPERKAVAEVCFELIDMNNKKVLFNKTFSASIKIAGNEVDDIVQAMSLSVLELFQQCAQEMEPFL